MISSECNFNKWEVFMLEKQLIGYFERDQIHVNTTKENIQLFEEYILPNLQTLLGQEKIPNLWLSSEGTFKGLPFISQQIRVCRNAFKNRDKWNFFAVSDDGWYIYCFNTKSAVPKLEYMWKTMQNSFRNKPRTKGVHAFSYLMDTIFNSGTILRLDAETLGTQKLLVKLKIKTFTDESLSKEKPVEEPGEKFINIVGSSNKKQKLCDACLKNPVRYMKIEYYCSEECSN